MAISVADYSTSDFNSLLDYADALPVFDGLDGDRLANGAMKDLFRRHNVQGTIGLALLHKHFNLCDGERVTDLRGTSNPVTFELGEASTWMFSPEPEFSKLLVSMKADGIRGLCSYSGDGYPGRVEFTVGRSNVNLTPEEANLLPPAGTREAAWFYTDDFMDRGCKCNCFKNEKDAHSHGYTASSWLGVEA
ncbi:hypothetical protein C8A00DRAFT_46198 [Chaetomidium leptoderma]|uniref:Uncharacterized protein n=1 Tax=Chaetomidium leptoderma TaxID=669021 RepID=A0AAN6VFM2_9PEZI|nr:hypothetical protein C8A00DRAFT_46198 [Chaetomidium leptoderma]